MLSCCCISCLAHLAVLYEAVNRTGPQVEMYNLCDSALQRLGTLTSELDPDEYTHLDLLLGVRPYSHRFPITMALNQRLAQDAWRKSLPVLDIRIESLPFEESESLRYCRKVIRKMCSDFHEGLPGCEPPMIYSLAMMEDGTTEESKYPNLMLFEVRMQFGI